MEMLFQNVPTLCHLDMTYAVKEIGMDYERSLFGMRVSGLGLGLGLGLGSRRSAWIMRGRYSACG